MDVATIAAGKKKGKTIKVNDAVFDCVYREGLIHQVVTAYLAKARSGSSKQKNRSDVRGGGAKPWRQKGTGRARHGTIRSPIWRGGGVTFAARPRNYEQKVNKKVFRFAMRSILSELYRRDRLLIVEEFDIAAPKTKDMIAMLKQFDLTKVLIVKDAVDENTYLSARNIPHVDVRDVQGADPVSLINCDKVLMTVSALRQFEEWLS